MRASCKPPYHQRRPASLTSRFVGRLQKRPTSRRVLRLLPRTLQLTTSPRYCSWLQRHGPQLRRPVTNRLSTSCTTKPWPLSHVYPRTASSSPPPVFYPQAMPPPQKPIGLFPPLRLGPLKPPFPLLPFWRRLKAAIAWIFLPFGGHPLRWLLLLCADGPRHGYARKEPRR